MSVTADNSTGSQPVPVFIVLSGDRRGRVAKLTAKTLRVVRGPDSDIQFLAPEDEHARQFHATLHRSGDSYEIEVPQERNVWINGKRVEVSQLLQSGDLLEIGRVGPVIRFRLYASGAEQTRSVAEVFEDSMDGARADGRTPLAKAANFIGHFAKDLATQTSLWFRVWVLLLLTALVVSVVALVIQNIRLQQRVAVEGTRIEEIADMLERSGAEAMTRADLVKLQAEVEQRLAAAAQRVEALEARSDWIARIIATASPSVAYVQGAFGFVDPDTGRPLRYIETEDGVTLFTTQENGQRVELMFSGTAFVVAEKGLLMTNRHVAEPWMDDYQVEAARQRGLTPVIWRLLGFLPGTTQAFELKVVRVSDEADLALLQASTALDSVPPLPLKAQQPQAGDEVVVLGYPLGMKGLVLRTSPEFLEAITPDGDADFWTVARRLAESGYIKPLASRGIVSQVSENIIVYDAETAVGGSGGPVLSPDGKVLAINAAILEEFGGSNLGVPAIVALKLLKP